MTEATQPEPTTEDNARTVGPSVAAASRLYLVARAGGLLAGLVGAIVAARLLGPDARGSLGLFVFAVTLGVAALGVGTPTAVYDVTAHGARDRGAALAGARLLVVLAGSVGALVLLAAASVDPVRTGLGAVPAGAVALAGGLAIGGILLGQTYTMSAVASGATALAAVGQALPLVSVAIAYVVTIGILGWGLTGAMVAYGLAGIASGVAVAWATSRAVRGPSSGERGGSSIRALLERGGRVAVADVAHALSYRLDVVLVAALAGLESLGRYSVGVQLVEPMAIAGTALGIAILGSAAESRAPTTLDPAVIGGVRTAIAVCLIGGSVGTAAMVVLGPTLLGPGFGSVPIVMAILVPGVAALAASRVVSGAVVGHGGLGVGSAIATAVVAVNVILNFVLLPAFAEIGAATASAISYCLALGLWLRAWRRRGGAARLSDLAPRAADVRALLTAIRGRVPRGTPSR